MSGELLTQLAALGVPETALQFRMVRASGPGGQHVNKVATAIELHCVVAACRLSEGAQTRLKTLAGRRLSGSGELIISAQRLRTQEQNRRDALERLLELIETARIVPKVRRPTKPTKASKVRRLDGKQRKGQQKSLRGKISAVD